MESEFLLLPSKQKVHAKLENSTLTLLSSAEQTFRNICCCSEKNYFEVFTKDEITSVQLSTTAITVKGFKKVIKEKAGITDFRPFEITLQNRSRKIIDTWKLHLDEAFSKTHKV